MTKEPIEFIFIIALFFNALFFIPQIFYIIKMKTAKGLSLITFIGLFLFQVVLFFYFFTIHDFNLVLASGFLASISVTGFITLLIWIYRYKKYFGIAGVSLEEIVAQLPGHIYWKDKKGIAVGGNTNNWKDFHFRSLEDYIGKTEYDMLPREEAEIIRNIDKEIMQTGIPKIVEESVTNKNGKMEDYLSHKIPLKNKNGDIVGLLGVSVDITAAKQETQDKLDMLENIIAVMPGTVYWMNRQGIYLGCNDNEAKVIGLASRKNIVGKRNIDLPGFLIAEFLDPINEKVMSTGEPITLEEPAVLQDGTHATFLSSKVALKNSRDIVVGMLGISVDITVQKQAEALKAKQALIENAAQVSHDIRSPLAALNTVLRNLSLLPEDQRTLIQNAVSRINDIANNLLVEYRDDPKNAQSLSSKKQGQPQLLSSLVDAIMSEKKAQTSGQDIELSLNIEPSAFGLFVIIDPIQFKSMISNLLNNAIEAIDKQGQVSVQLGKYQNKLHITINDTGKGIAPDVLNKIKHGGVSYQKQGGTGIGIASAITLIKNCHGDFDMTSTVNQGTTVTIDLPRTPAPTWFQEELLLTPGMTLVVLDDDESIHAIWTSRCHPFINQITIKHFHHNKTFDEYCRNTTDLSNTLFLVDYELLGFSVSGLDLIEQFNLSAHAILVTSRYEENKVRHRADKLKIKIIPKNYSPYIPILLEDTDAPKLIFLDDDKNLTQVWEREAQHKGILIKTFNRSGDLRKVLSSLAKNTPIYVDSNLHEAVSGEIFAKELFEQGFTELYLASGYPSGHFKDLPWIKDFVGKEPPF